MVRFSTITDEEWQNRVNLAACYHLADHFNMSDIIGIILLPKQLLKKIPYNCFNIGYGKANKLITFLHLIEKNLNKEAIIKNLLLQKGDVKKTHASVKSLKKYSFYRPKINIEKE